MEKLSMHTRDLARNNVAGIGKMFPLCLTGHLNGNGQVQDRLFIGMMRREETSGPHKYTAPHPDGIAELSEYAENYALSSGIHGLHGNTGACNEKSMFLCRKRGFAVRGPLKGKIIALVLTLALVLPAGSCRRDAAAPALSAATVLKEVSLAIIPDCDGGVLFEFSSYTSQDEMDTVMLNISVTPDTHIRYFTPDAFRYKVAFLLNDGSKGPFDGDDFVVETNLVTPVTEQGAPRLAIGAPLTSEQVQDRLLKHPTGYSVALLIESTDGEAAVQTAFLPVTVDERAIGYGTDLNGGANCYVISEAGYYRFKPFKGNSGEPVTGIERVEILWQVSGDGATAANVISIERHTDYDGYIKLRANGNEGNALIVAQGKNYHPLWSWHIWCTDPPAEDVYLDGAGVMMDRNLGATEVSLDSQAKGLLYQWGRKDPLTRTAEKGSRWGGRGVNMDDAIREPGRVFYVDSDYGPFNWYEGTDPEPDSLWGPVKTMYDPCPAGYRVPDGGPEGIWAKGNFEKYRKTQPLSYVWSFEIEGGSTPYPFGGYYSPRKAYLCDGDYTHVDKDRDQAMYWSCTPCGENAYQLYFTAYQMTVNSAREASRGFGTAVRCAKESL